MSDSNMERELPADSPIATGDPVDAAHAATGSDRPARESLNQGSGLSVKPSEAEAEPDAVQALEAEHAEPSEAEAEPGAAQATEEEAPTEQPSRRADALWEKVSEYPHLPPAIKQIAVRRRTEDFAEQSVRYLARKDPEANAATRLPSSEQILTPLIWLAEVFTPTTIDNLVKGVRELTAKTEGSLLNSEGDLGEWVLSSRRQGSFAYSPVPYVAPRSRPILAPRIVDQVPVGIDYIRPAIQTLTSTVSVLTVAFRLKDDRARELSKILNQNFATRARINPNGSSFEILDVSRQKAEAVNEWRSKLRSEAAGWIAERFPGFFCRIAPERMPMIDLLLTKSYIPWEFQARNDIPDWAKIVDLATWSGYWQAIGNDVLPSAGWP
jgi:hypothetical protein